MSRFDNTPTEDLVDGVIFSMDNIRWIINRQAEIGGVDYIKECDRVDTHLRDLTDCLGELKTRWTAPKPEESK